MTPQPLHILSLVLSMEPIVSHERLARGCRRPATVRVRMVAAHMMARFRAMSTTEIAEVNELGYACNGGPQYAATKIRSGTDPQLHRLYCRAMTKARCMGWRELAHERPFAHGVSAANRQPFGIAE